MSAYAIPCIVKYEGIAEDDVEADEYLSTTYVAIKKQPFYTTLAVRGRPGFFFTCTTKVSLHYYDSNSHSVSADRVTFVSTFPIEYKTRVSTDGTELEVETTIYSLSSQHQGALFSVVIEAIENVSQYRHLVATVPLKVVSKSDCLSATIPTPEGRRITVTEVLGAALNNVELTEIQNTKMLSALCKSKGIQTDVTPSNALKHADLGGLVQRLCEEYRQIVKSQRHHRLLCEVEGLTDNDLELLSRVNVAFCDSFQRAFDANYELFMSQKRTKHN